MSGGGERSGKRTLFVRLAVYVLGLFILTFGSILSINTGMGLSAGNAFPYAFSRASGISFGYSLIAVYCGYVALQFILLGKACPASNLLQVPVALLYGRFADFWVWIIGDFAPESYGGRFAMLLASIAFVGLGVAVYVAPNIMRNPIEGLSFALAQRLRRPFYQGKTLLDCLSVLGGLILCIACLGEIVGIREGTVLSALLTGKAVDLCSRVVEPLTVRLAGTDAFIQR